MERAERESGRGKGCMKRWRGRWGWESGEIFGYYVREVCGRVVSGMEIGLSGSGGSQRGPRRTRDGRVFQVGSDGCR